MDDAEASKIEVMKKGTRSRGEDRGGAHPNRAAPPPALGTLAVAVFPLKRNEPRLVELARSIKRDLQRVGLRAVYDDTGAIGKLYRRQDEIGTPWCITVDFQSLEDKTVTVRDRDSMQQERAPLGELGSTLLARLR